jgi:multidrug efflux pump subunit AcrB|tara:strand:+ start:12130 stop:15180 length:3051 start_codon:yes stop_codon:yes gene_type:complete
MISALVRQHRAVHILFITVFILGYLSLQKLGREELPEFGGDGLNITAILPGGSPQEVDLKVARPLHNAIKDIPGVEQVTSTSREGLVSLAVELMTDESDHVGLRREITQVLSQVPDLPDELEGPYVSRQQDRLFPAITLLFKGGTDVERHIEWLKVAQILSGLSELDAVEVLGDRDRRVEIRLDPIRLQHAALRIDGVAHAVQAALTDAGAGQVDQRMNTMRMRTRVQPATVAEIANLPLQTRNGVIPIHQIASVVDALEQEKVRVLHDGERVWYINLFRRSGSNITDLSRKVREITSHLNQQFEDDQQPYSIDILYDRSTVVTGNLDEMKVAILQGMALVLLILWLFLGIRNAFYAAIGIPFSFFAVFIAMDLLGLSINTLTLFGLVLVCGMIVDDAIVVLENIHRKRIEGKTGIAAIAAGLKEVAPAVVAATGTTIAAFLPLLLMTGGMGMYITQIPQVAILALIASLVECLFILPVHLYRRTSGDRSEGRAHRAMVSAAGAFANLAGALVRYPYRSLTGFTLLLFVTGAVAYVNMDFELFSASETRVIRFHLEFPKSTDLDSMQELIDHGIEQMAPYRNQLDDIIGIIGWKSYNYRTEVRNHLATLELILADKDLSYDDARQLSDELASRLDSLPGLVRLQVSLETNSPPKDAPVSIYLYGNDSESLKGSSRRVRRILSEIPAIEHISDPMEDGIPEQVFEVNGETARFYGLSANEIGTLLRWAVTGFKAGKIDRGDEVIDLYVKSGTSHLTHLTRADGRVLPLSELGDFTLITAPDGVFRHNGDRYITIEAEINEDLSSVFRTHREIEARLNASVLSTGVTFEQQGEFSQTQESLTSMIQSGVIAIGLSYLILATLFRSFAQPIIVLMVIPLAYMGVVWGMTLTGQTLTLMGFVGVVGLIGIVVNDALVWVSFYNSSREAGLDSKRAAVKAVERRFQPIWLTTLTTVCGLLPASLGDGAGIAQAMAHTMVYGLVTSSFLLLVFLPVCVVVLDDLTDRIGHTFRSIMPAIAPA